MFEEENQEKANINALMDSVYVIDNALLFESTNSKQKLQSLLSNAHHIEQQLRKPIYQEALSEQDKATCESAVQRARAAIATAAQE
jgi:uncharacterized protein YhaN